VQASLPRLKFDLDAFEPNCHLENFFPTVQQTKEDELSGKLHVTKFTYSFTLLGAQTHSPGWTTACRNKH